MKDNMSPSSKADLRTRLNTNKRRTSIYELEDKREEVNAKSCIIGATLGVLFVLTPIIVIMMNPAQANLGFNTFAVMSCLLALFIILVMIPQAKVIYQAKAHFLQEYMNRYQPTTEYLFRPYTKDYKEVIRDYEVFSQYYTSYFVQSNIIEGIKGDTEFYISDFHTPNKGDNNDKFFLEGVMVQMKIKDKNFPKSVILSHNGLPFKVLEKVRTFPNFDFLFYSNNENQFYKQFSFLFPFITHLQKQMGILYIKVENDKLFMLLPYRLRVISPSIRTNKTFHNELYFNQITRYLNSIFFIMDSFTQNLSADELVLRVQQTIENYVED